MDIGFDGVSCDSCNIFDGVDGLDGTSMTVGVDVVSDGLRDVILFVSENVLPGPLWFDMGNAAAFSTWTPVLAWARGGVALKPRSAKLMVLEIRDAFGTTAAFMAGFFGETLLKETGLWGTEVDGSNRRGRNERLFSVPAVSCSLKREIDRAEIRSCAIAT